MSAPCGSDVLIKLAGYDATKAFASVGHSSAADSLLKSFCVGTLEQDDFDKYKAENDSSTLINSAAPER